jgi:uncharacterized protein
MTYDETADADARIAKLERALIRHDGIIIAELDGFITALWLLPKEPPAESWLPYVFGWGKEEAFVGDVEMARLISDHYAGVGYELRTGTYNPVYMFTGEGEEEQVAWEPWIDGFAAVIGLFPDAFEPLMKTEGDAAESFQMLVGLAAVAMDDPETTGEMGEETVAELREAAPDMIPECVYVLYEARLEASGALEPRKVTATGRNDPCPCGSGKKFKKCCGAA